MISPSHTAEKTKALSLSILVHGLFLAAFYFLVIFNTSQLPQLTNQVTFDLKEVTAPSSVPPPNLPKVTEVKPIPPKKPVQQKSEKEIPQTGQEVQKDPSPVDAKEEKKELEPAPTEQPKTTEKELPPAPTDETEDTDEPPSTDQDPSNSNGDNPEATEEQETENTELDERALYTSNTKKETGALLELTGWLWDTLPSPEDTSDETGKIVFEIKVDSMGEVISVKTLEKTISASTEKIYKASLEQLTFSKTEDNGSDEAVSTGKITFFIRAR